MIRRFVNDELEMIWKEAVVACFNTLSQKVAGRTEKYENPVRRFEIQTRTYRIKAGESDVG
jgi:hypothetical protein